MAFQTVALQPGVKVIQTPTLLRANVVASNLIRWKGGLPEKMGGWQNYLSFSYTPIDSTFALPGITRMLWAWEDLDGATHIAAAGTQGLYTSAINPGPTSTTPPPEVSARYQVFTIAQIQTTAGTPGVTPGVVTVNLTGGMPQYGYTSFFFTTHNAVGNIVLFGTYPVTKIVWVDSGHATLTIDATRSAPLNTTVGSPMEGLPDPTLITAGIVTSGYTAKFSVPTHSTTVSVLIPNALNPGDTFSIKAPTTVGGIPLKGFYTVASDPPPVHSGPTAGFSFNAQVASTSSGSNVWEGGTDSTPGTGVGTGFAWMSFGSGQTVSGAQYPQITGVPMGSPFDGATPDSWSLANWGSQLLSSPMNGAISSWDPTSGAQNSTVIANGPSNCRGFFIAMPQQMIVAFGSSQTKFNIQDPMLVIWCDAGNFNVWDASASNQAGSFRLTRGSKIMAGCQGPQAGMLWTDVGLWLMTYLGYPDVWGFSEIAQGCGIIGKDAWCTYGPQVFWLGNDAFWVFTNGAVQRLECDVWDVIFRNLGPTPDYEHIRAGTNSNFNEVQWFFPSAASASSTNPHENDSWVKFNVMTGEWDYSFTTPPPGELWQGSATAVNVTAWLDTNAIVSRPLSSMIQNVTSTWIHNPLPPPSSNIMMHEVTEDANGKAITWMIQTGFFQLSEGEDKVFVDYVLPDFRWRRWPHPQTESATVLFTLYVCDDPDNPLAPAIALGPYTVTNSTTNGVNNLISPGGIEVRCRGRYFFAIIQGNDTGKFVRLGGIKFRFAPDGRN